MGTCPFLLQRPNVQSAILLQVKDVYIPKDFYSGGCAARWCAAAAAALVTSRAHQLKHACPLLGSKLVLFNYGLQGGRGE